MLSLKHCCCLVSSVVSDSVQPYDCSLPVSVHGIFLARDLEWFAISSSRGSFRPKGQTHVSCIKVDSLLLGSIGYGQLKIQERDRLNNLPN